MLKTILIILLFGITNGRQNNIFQDYENPIKYQEFNQQRELKQTTACQLTTTQIDTIYNSELSIWTLTENYINNEITNDIQIIVDCASEGDIIMFNMISSAIIPIDTISISTENLTFTGFTENIEIANGTFPKADSKAIFTCNGNNAIFEIKSSDVTFANIEINDCSFGQEDNSSPILFINSCDTFENRGIIRFHHVIFQRNLNYLNAGCFMTSTDGNGIICSSLEFEDVEFIDNESMGWVIGQMLPITNMNNVKFTQNRFIENEAVTDVIFDGVLIYIPSGYELYADNIEASDNHGNIFYLNGSSIKLSNSKFESNDGNYTKFIVPVCINGNNANINIENCILSNSTPSFIKILESILDIKNSIFENLYQEINSKQSETGAIIALNSSLLISGSEFNYNGASNIGGAIKSTDTNMDIENSTFLNNTAETGGAIYSVCYEYCLLNIKTSYFEKNTASVNGGGGISINQKSNIKIENSNFTENSAMSDGGAFIGFNNGEASYDFYNIIFSKNMAQGVGGAIRLGSSSNYYIYMNLIGCQIINNIAFTSNAGGMATTAQLNITIKDTLFKSNIGNNNGAAIDSFTQGLYPSHYYIVNTTFENNSADRGRGGAFSIAGTNTDGIETVIIMENSSFIGNTAYDGGALNVFYTLDIVLKNVTMMGNYATNNGAGIYITLDKKNMNLTIENSLISNNTALYAGAGIYSNGGTFVLVNTIVKHNVAGDWGGGVFITYPSNYTIANITNCSFIENSAENSTGGGLLLYNNFTLWLEKSQFIRNSAGDRAAGIYLEDSQTGSNITITETIFEENQCGNAGSAIYMKTSLYVNLTKSIFKNNKNKNSNVRGGTIATDVTRWYTSDGLSNINMQYTRYKDARESAGLLEISNYEIDNSTFPCLIMYLEDSEFSGNNAMYAYHALFNLEDGVLFNVKNCTFSDNDSQERGIIYVKNSEFYCNECTFLRNDALSTGLFYVYSTAITDDEPKTIVVIQNSYFSENEVTRLGGGVMEAFKSNIIIKNTTFEKNKGDSGGCLKLIESDIELHDVEFIDNKSSSVGGAIYVDGKSSHSNLIINNLLCESNLSGKGGCLYIIGIVDTNIQNSIFHDNEANHNLTSEGGAIGCSSSTNYSIMIINNCIFTSNRVINGHGGVFYINGYYYLNMTSLLFSKNYANDSDTSGNGGSLYISGSGWLIYGRSSEVSDFPPNVFGIQDVVQDKFNVTNISFSEIVPSVVMQMVNVTFEENSAIANKAGAIYSEDGVFIDMDKCTFLKNQAKFAGAISSINSEIYMNNCIFESNSALDYAGAIFIDHIDKYDYNEFSLIVMQNSNFSINSASDGGAIYAAKSTCAIYLLGNDNFIKNEVERDGGAIFIQKGAVIYSKNSYFDNNVAGKVGGAITLKTNVTDMIRYYFENTIFKRNHAWKGGALYVLEEDYGNICLSNSIHNDSSLYLSNAIMDNNTADLAGGVIMVNSPSITINDCDGVGTLIPDEFATSELSYIYFFEDATPYFLEENTCPNWKNNNVGNGGYGIITASDPVNVHPNFDSKLKEMLDINCGNSIDNEKGCNIIGLKNSTIKYLKFDLILRDIFENNAIQPMGNDLVATVTTDSDFLHVKNSTFNLNDGMTNVTVTLSDESIKSSILLISFNVPDFENITLDIDLKKCTNGQQISDDGKDCEDCGVFAYNFHPESEICHECPNNLICMGATVFPYSGYWNSHPCSHYTDNCIFFEACSYKDRDVILFGLTSELYTCNLNNTIYNEYIDALCSEGYKGPLCGSCEKNYGHLSTYECAKCSKDNYGSVISYLFSGIVLIIAVCISIHGNIKRTTQDEKDSIDNNANQEIQPGPEGTSQNKATLKPMYSMDKEGYVKNINPEVVNIYKNTMIETFKIFINYMQVTSIAISVHVNWTEPMVDLFKSFDFLGMVSAATTYTSLDCIISDSFSTNKAIIRSLLILFLPLVIFLIFFLCYVFKTIKYKKSFSFLSQRTFLSVLVISYISYLNITKYLIQFIYCAEVYEYIDIENAENEKLLWMEDTTVECYTGVHRIIAAVLIWPSLFLFSIGFPIFLIVILNYFKTKKQLNDDKIEETLGFLYRTYRVEFIYWDSIIMLRKATLAIIVVYTYSLGGNQQGILTLLVLMISLSLNLYISPYKLEFNILNKFESMSLLVCVFTFTSGLLFNDPKARKTLKVIMTVSILLINLLLCIVLVTIILHRLYMFIKVKLVLEKVVNEEDYWLDVFKKFVQSYYQKAKNSVMKKLSNLSSNIN